MGGCGRLKIKKKICKKMCHIYDDYSSKRMNGNYFRQYRKCRECGKIYSYIRKYEMCLGFNGRGRQ